MKKIIAVTIFTLFSIGALATGPVQVPYTLYGAEDCSVEILDFGSEVPSPEKMSGTYFMEVVVSSMPNTTFLLKSKDGRLFHGIDPRTRTRMRIHGSPVFLPVPMLRGTYGLWRGKENLDSCSQLSLKN